MIDLISCINGSIKSEITLGDLSCMKDKGKGIVPILTKQNSEKYIHDVYYVPQLKHNLITIGKLTEHDYNVIFQVTSCYIFYKPPSRRLISKVEKTRNIMFHLSFGSTNMSQSFAHNISKIGESHLWHFRLLKNVTRFGLHKCI